MLNLATMTKRKKQTDKFAKIKLYNNKMLQS